MPRRFFTRLSRRFTRNPENTPWYLKPFSYLATHPVYFSTKRRSVSGGIALGLFLGMLPIPGQTPLAVAGALLMRFNIPLAAVSVWISNPITFVPLFYFAYRVGALLLDLQPEALPPEVTVESLFYWLTANFPSHGRALIYGSLLMAASVSSIAYLSISAAWHLITINKYKRRHRDAARRRAASSSG